MNKAVFLDRDGVINRERGYTFQLEDFEILPDVMEVLAEFQKRGYLLIIVTNQSGVAKELYGQKDVEKLHKYLLSEFKKNKINISEIYYCIHHPDTTKCICRKPGSLLIEKALARFDIDPAKSYFIGDKDRDIQAGEKAGVKGILIEANDSLKKLLNVIE
jgi:D-glycero-D-manno-heptose 1,7-bisphosphate phosphatase